MESGARLGPYEILEQLGAGGMGEVYLADDPRLGRKVAIKVLPATFADDPERLARFEQEARASAALNHPNIAQVYDVGAEGEGSEQTLYMVQEYLEGQTLEDLLAEGPLPAKRALSVGEEIARALAAAHAAGIVHRDLKPGNVFVSPGGHAKVLDFGLAKLTEGSAVSTSGDASMSPTVVGTIAGSILGTAGYMAPEQVSGQEVDRRADLFAFGCVLHEMLAGRRAFAGKSVPDTLAKILHEEPEPPGNLGPELMRLLEKCLAKEPAERYQHADDLVVDLRYLADAGPAALAAAPAAAQPQRRGLNPALATAIAVGALALGVFGGRLTGGSEPVAVAPALPRPVKLTEFATVATEPAISANGQMVAFLASDPADGWPQVYVKPLPDGPPLRLTSTADHKDFLAFSPDGAQVAYTVLGEAAWDTWTVSIAGGEPQLWLRNANALTWAPDGRLLFSQFKVGRHLGIVRADASGGNQEEIWFPPLPRQMAHSSDISPDGSRIAIGYMGSTVDRGVRCFVAGVDGIEGEPPSLDVGPDAPPCGMRSRWSADGEWLYYQSALGPEIWRARPAGGGAEPVVVESPGIENIAGFALAPDGGSLIYAGEARSESVWIREPDGRQRQLTFEAIADQPSISSDGRRVLYRQEERGPGDALWSYDLESGSREPICRGLRVVSYWPARDDARILVRARLADGGTEPWLCFRDASQPPRALGARGDSGPMLLSHDGQTFYYTVPRRGATADAHLDPGGAGLFSQSVDGGEPQRIRDESPGRLLALSPDGEWLAVDGGLGSRQETWLVPMDGGEPRLAVRGWRLWWNQDNSAFLFVMDGRLSTAWSLPNPQGHLLPPDLPESPDPDWLRDAGAVRVLAEFDFAEVAASPRLHEIVFTRRSRSGNLYRVELTQ